MKEVVYIHIPFCPSGCKFCHFYLDSKNTNGYIDLIEQEFLLRFGDTKIQVDTIHIGGGTPNMLPKREFIKLFECIQRRFFGYQELSIELHPALLSFEQLDILKRFGVNRISLGIQTFDANILGQHTRVALNYDNLGSFIEYAQKLGFEKINFDLIYDLVNDSIENIKYNLSFIEKFKPSSVNYYGLRILTEYIKNIYQYHPERRFYMYLYIRQKLNEMGYIQKNDVVYHTKEFGNGTNFLYEDSIYAKEHTLYGLGVAASSHLGSTFSKNSTSLEEYTQAIQKGIYKPGLEFQLSSLGFLLYKFYFLMLMYSSIGVDLFDSIYGAGSLKAISQNIQQMQGYGFLYMDQRSISLTQKGIFSLEKMEELLFSNHPNELELLRKL